MTRTRKSGRVAGLMVAAWLPLAGCSYGPADQTGENGAGRFTLDPELYREEIAAVEAVLYQDSPLAASDLDRLSGAMFQLGSKALTQEDHPLRKEKARLIMSLAARGDLSSVLVTPLPQLGELRAEWEALRHEAFQPASWLRPDSTGATSLQPARTPPVSAGEIRAVGFVLERLETLCQQGRWEVAELNTVGAASDRPGNGGPPEDQRWRDWSTRWEERIQEALVGLPTRSGADASSDYLQVHHIIAQAVGELRMVPVGSGQGTPPRPYQWERRFTRAEEALDDARMLLLAGD